MTIYDAAPVILGLWIAAFGTTLCLIDHRKIVARRKARAAARAQVAAE